MIDPTRMQVFQLLAETGLSARELLEMDMDEYARVTGRSLKLQPEPVADPPAALPDTATRGG